MIVNFLFVIVNLSLRLSDKNILMDLL